jgi:hypothetical protein
MKLPALHNRLLNRLHEIFLRHIVIGLDLFIASVVVASGAITLEAIVVALEASINVGTKMLPPKHQSRTRRSRWSFFLVIAVTVKSFPIGGLFVRCKIKSKMNHHGDVLEYQ